MVSFLVNIDVFMNFIAFYDISLILIILLKIVMIYLYQNCCYEKNKRDASAFYFSYIINLAKFI